MGFWAQELTNRRNVSLVYSPHTNVTLRGLRQQVDYMFRVRPRQFSLAPITRLTKVIWEQAASQRVRLLRGGEFDVTPARSVCIADRCVTSTDMSHAALGDSIEFIGAIQINLSIYLSTTASEWWGAGVVICLERDVDLHMAQLMPLPLTSVKSRLV